MGKDVFLQGQKEKLLLGLGCCIGFILWFQFFLVPQRQIGFDRRSRVQVMRKQLQRTRQSLKQLPELERRVQQLSSQSGLVFTTPPEEQLPELLETIAQTARASQVQLLTVRPTLDLNQLQPGATGFLELPVRLEAVAGYHQIGTFLGALEHSESLIQLQSLEIMADPKENWRHQANFVLQVYLLPGKEGAKSR